MESVWTKDYKDNNLPKIENNLETPILIIGGGIAGLMCAYNLMKNKVKFILIDSKKLARGVSMYTTAQVSIAHGPLYEEINKKLGIKKAQIYLKSQKEGFDLIKEIITTEKIECDYKEESTILYTNEEKNIEILNKQFDIIKNIYSNIDLVSSENNIINYQKGLEFKNQFIFNPIKYMMKIIDILIENNIPLYENSQATKIKKSRYGYKVFINNKYTITTNKIIMACHYPFLNPDNLYFTKIYQSKSYAVSFKTNIKLNANYVSLDAPYFYFRTYDKDRLIIGGCDHFTGSNSDINNCYETLTKKIKAIDNNAQIELKWFTEDCIPIDSLPYVGFYSRCNPNIILVTGFQKWGFTNSHIAARNVIDILNNTHDDYLFKTHRWTLFRDIKSTIRMISHSINGLILSKLNIRDYQLNNIKINSGKVIKYKGTNVLVYRESKNKYIMLKNKCTHMGCSLIWNDIDKLWESKCHGSIFDKYGKVLYGPATKDLEKFE